MKSYLSRVWQLYWRVSLIHLAVVLFALIVVGNIAPLLQPQLVKFDLIVLVLAFIFYSIFFPLLNFAWSLLVEIFQGPLYVTAGVVLAVIFQIGLILLSVLTSANTSDFSSFRNGENVVFLSYGIVLAAGLFWSYLTETSLSKMVKTSPGPTGEFR